MLLPRQKQLMSIPGPTLGPRAPARRRRKRGGRPGAGMGDASGSRLTVYEPSADFPPRSIGENPQVSQCATLS